MNGNIQEYREKYYNTKMNINPADFPEQINLMSRKYIEGLSWVF